MQINYDVTRPDLGISFTFEAKTGLATLIKIIQCNTFGDTREEKFFFSIF
jgi:hypothetical protein